jgi:hypothetical protein
MKSTAQRLSEAYSRLSDENHEAEKQQLREAAALAGYYGGVSLTHSYYGGLPKPSEYTFHASVNGMIRGEAGQYFEDELKGRGKTEIPVSNFIDLLKDSIVAWRLEGDGFNPHPWKGSVMYEIQLSDRKSISIVDDVVTAWNDADENANIGLPMNGLTTYTDLLTLIRLIG